MIKIQGLSKRHGSRIVLNKLDAQVVAGETIAITGPSGVGKSTLLRCLNYLEPFQEGVIEISGFELRPGMDRGHKNELRQLRASVGMVFQQFNLFPHLTAIENIALAPRLVAGISKSVAEKEALDLLARVHLADRGGAYSHQLSGGQQQRVAIARALAQKPKVLLFDEPTSALDPAMKQEVLDVMKELANDGMTMLVVTHEMKFASKIATRIWEIREGKIVKDTTSHP